MVLLSILPTTVYLSSGATLDTGLSLKTPFIWPLHSPDLNPLDYWFWSHMKSILDQFGVLWICHTLFWEFPGISGLDMMRGIQKS